MYIYIERERERELLQYFKNLFNFKKYINQIIRNKYARV